jgi:hypothetical protein
MSALGHTRTLVTLVADAVGLSKPIVRAKTLSPS